MPREHGRTVTLSQALDAALSAARVLVGRDADCAHEWREVVGWIEAAQNDLRLTRSLHASAALFSENTSTLVQHLDGQLALAAEFVDSLAVEEARRASDHAQRRARLAPPGGPVRNGGGHAAQ